MRAGILAALLLLAAGPSQAFEREQWLADLGQARAAMAAKYANLEWAAFEHEIDLDELFADARTRIGNATSDAEARAAFDRLLRRLGDGHAVINWQAAAKQTAPAAPGPVSCASLDYDARRGRANPVAMFAPGYNSLESPPSPAFPAGLIDVNGKRVGVIQIPLFSPTGFPELCEAALKALNLTQLKACDDACADRIETWAANRMGETLAGRIRQLANAGAALLLIDVAGNGGGSEWVEAVMRMLTPVRLKSSSMYFVRGPHWAEKFEHTEADLRRHALHADPIERTLLLRLAAEAAQRRREALAPCDSNPLFHREHPACAWLGRGFYGSGLVAEAPPRDQKTRPWASLVFTPYEFEYEAGIWQGPLIVLVDSDTASAAEEFAAVLQDNRAAVVIGSPTVGAGCGYTDGGTPTTLRFSGGVLKLPDCVRLRADGTNEVMGVEPDVLAGFLHQDGPHRRGQRFLQKLPEAVDRAEALHRQTRTE
jgi:peptidase S41-like protein